MLTERRLLTTKTGKDQTKPVCTKMDPSADISPTFAQGLRFNMLISYTMPEET